MLAHSRVTRDADLGPWLQKYLSRENAQNYPQVERDQQRAAPSNPVGDKDLLFIGSQGFARLSESHMRTTLMGKLANMGIGSHSSDKPWICP